MQFFKSRRNIALSLILLGALIIQPNYYVSLARDYGFLTNDLANLEALSMLLKNGLEFACLAAGIYLLVTSMVKHRMHPVKTILPAMAATCLILVSLGS